jgi:hypothetical protein
MPDRSLSPPLSPVVSSPWASLAPYPLRVWIDSSGVVHWEGQVTAQASALTQSTFSVVAASVAVPGSGQVFAPVFYPGTALNNAGQTQLVPCLVNSAQGLAQLVCAQTVSGPQLGIAVLSTLGTSGFVLVGLTGFSYRVDA